MLQGTNINFIKEIARSTNKPITAAGGISTIEEIIELSKNNISCQLGMAIYTGKINLEDAFCACLDFEKMQGLIPTVVQDKMTKQVLMLAYSTPESLKKSLTLSIKNLTITVRLVILKSQSQTYSPNASAFS